MKQASLVTESRLRQLIDKYLPVGIVWGNELCLRPTDALRLVGDLEALGVAILGVDGWRFSNPEHERNRSLTPDLSVDFYVGDEALRSSDPARESVKLVRYYLTHSRPEGTQLISLSLDVPPAWDLLPKETVS